MSGSTERCLSFLVTLVMTGTLVVICGCGGGGSVSPPPPSAPNLTSLQPSTINAGSAGFSLVVNGSGFVNGSTVLWNGTARTTSFINSNSVSATISSGDVAQQGSAIITATNPGTSVSNPLTFTITAAVPSSSLALQVNRLVYDPGRKRIYASVPSRAGTPYGDTVTIIDPSKSAITGSISVGSEPNAMAISQDGKYLYVGLDGTGSIRKVDLANQTAGLQFAVGNDSNFGAMRAEDIAVMPGNAEVIAVSRRYNGVSPGHAGVAIYDNGVQRPNTTPGHTGANRIEFSDSPSTLFGYNNETSENGFRRMTVDAAGVSVTATTTGLIQGWGDIAYDSGRIYSTSGVVIDPLAPSPLGKFTDVGWSSSVVPDSTAGRVYFLCNSTQGRYAIVGYDPTTFLKLGSLVLPQSVSSPTNLVRWGESGFAFTTSDQVWVIGGPFTPDPPAPLGLDKLPVNHLVYDASRDRIYASVPGQAGVQGNSIAVINAATSSIESTIFVGSEPNVLALSADAKCLYVGLDGAGAVRKLDLVSKTPDLQFRLGMGYYGPALARDIAVMPDSSETVAVASILGVAIYDSGVPRPTVASNGDNVIQFASSPLTLYGYNNGSSTVLHHMSVDANGVSVASTASLPNFGPDMVYESARLYSAAGTIVDPSVPAILGTLAPPAGSYGDSVALDLSAGRVYLLAAGYSGPPAVVAYDAATFVPVGSLAVTSAPVGRGHDLVRYGAGFAFVTANHNIAFASGAFTPTPSIGSVDKLPANAMVYDFGRRRIYASVPSRAGDRGNSITVINPETSVIEASIFVGSEPNALALSQDGTYLYVGLDGAAAVRRLDLSTQAAGLQFALGTGSFGTIYAEDIAVMPGNAEAVAVSRRYSGVSPRHAGVAIFDNGVQRPNTTPGHTGSNRIEFSESGSTLFGYNNETTDFGFRRMKVDSSGVSVLDSSSYLISGFGVDILYDRGTIYSSNGAVVDPVADVRAGQFSVSAGVSVAVDPTANRTYFLTNPGSSRNTILAYDQTRFTLAGSFDVPGNGYSGRNLVHCGGTLFAFLGSNDQVVITTANFVAPPTPALDKLKANHLIYDRGRNRIYASLSSANGSLGNTVAVINPSTLSIESSVFVGSEPNALALSDDGKYLYLGLDGSGAVRRVDMTTQTPDLQFSLGTGYYTGPRYAEDIAVMPGNPQTVAISRRNSGFSPRHEGVAIYDNGVQRPNTTPVHTGANRIEFSNSASLLYGYNNETTEFGFRWMTLDANGVSVTSTNTSLVGGFGVDMVYDSGLVYFTTGAVIDPATATVKGTFTGAAGYDVIPEASAGRVYFLSTNSAGRANLVGYSSATFARIGSVDVPGATGPGHDFVRWGPTGFAVATDTQLIITSGLLPEPKPLTVATTVLPPTMSGRMYDFTLASVGGLSPVNWNVIGGSLPPGLTLSTDGRISGVVGSINGMSSYAFTVQVTDSDSPVATATKDLTIDVKSILGGNGTCSTATPISPGRLAASLSPYGDVDIYAFDGVQGQFVSLETFAQRLDLDGDPSNVDSRADTFLELLGSECSPLATNDDISSDLLDSRIIGFQLPYTGRYYIRVSDARGDGRPDLLYRLSLWIE